MYCKVFWGNSIQDKVTVHCSLANVKHRRRGSPVSLVRNQRLAKTLKHIIPQLLVSLLHQVTLFLQICTNSVCWNKSPIPNMLVSLHKGSPSDTGPLTTVAEVLHSFTARTIKRTITPCPQHPAQLMIVLILDSEAVSNLELFTIRGWKIKTWSPVLSVSGQHDRKRGKRQLPLTGTYLIKIAAAGLDPSLSCSPHTTERGQKERGPTCSVCVRVTAPPPSSLVASSPLQDIQN